MTLSNININKLITQEIMTFSIHSIPCADVEVCIGTTIFWGEFCQFTLLLFMNLEKWTRISFFSFMVGSVAINFLETA